MSPYLEVKIGNCIIRMHDVGFGLTVDKLRWVVYKVYEYARINIKVKWLVVIGGTRCENYRICH